MKTTLIAAFQKMIIEMAAKHPDLSFKKADEESVVKLDFPKASDTGFSIRVQVYDGAVHIETDHGWHMDEQEVSPEQLQEMMGLVRDMLSSNMRVRVLYAGDRPYRWYLEAFDGTKWLSDGTTGLLFWNYFGKRTERIFQNNTLPVRPLRAEKN